MSTGHHRTPVSRRRLPMLKMVPPRDTVAPAIVHLADDLANLSVGSPSTDVLDRFRRRLGASDVTVWLCDGGSASRTAHAGEHAASTDPQLVNLSGGTVVVERLLHSGTVVCRFGDVSGLEPLVPAAVRSFVAAAVRWRDAATAILIVGWTQSAPALEGSPHELRVAANLIARTLTDGWSDRRIDMPDAILSSISERVAVVDARGVITAVNAAWMETGRQHGIRSWDIISTGANYLEVCRRSAASGCTDARVVIDGLAAICAGTSPIFQATYANDTPEQQRWGLVTITPLKRPGGGAAITHSDLAHAAIVDMARRLGDARFRTIAESVPVPLWIVGPDGRVVYGNERWLEQAGGTHHLHGEHWMDACHPDDRERATAAFRGSVSRLDRFEVEVRLKAADGAYRWCVCTAMPRYKSDGRLEGYVGVCSDASAKRRAESAFNRIAGKLVSAQEMERSRIARELHDDLGQQVAVLASKLDTALYSRSGLKATRELLGESRVHLRDIATSLHTLSHQLHPGKLRLLGLVPTLEGLCRDESEGMGVHVELRARHVPRNVDSDTALTLFRVAQESLRNALKHSGATAITVSVAGSEKHLALRVSDNGSGFNPLASNASGLGLLTMRECAELAGGSLAVMPVRPHGTTIRIVVPMKLAPPVSEGPWPDAGAPAPGLAGDPRTSPASAGRGPGSRE